MKDLIKRIPIISSLARKLKKKLFPKTFPGSEKYWINRYISGGNSGAGSYRKLAKFKAKILNDFVRENKISSVIEFGCGDGNQLKLTHYPFYIGFDVSPKAISLCKKIYETDETKSFMLMNEYKGETAQLTLSLDVVYHLIEDNIFNEYMVRLFNSSKRFVIIYSSNTDNNSPDQESHVKHRKFTDWIETNKPNWKLICHIPNKYPLTADDKEGSFADFYIFEKK